MQSLAIRNEQVASITKLQYCKALEYFFSCVNEAYKQPFALHIKKAEVEKCRATFLQQVRSLRLPDNVDVNLCNDQNINN